MPDDNDRPNSPADQPTGKGSSADGNDVTNTAVNPEHHLTATADIPEDDPQEVLPDAADDEDTDEGKRTGGSGQA